PQENFQEQLALAEMWQALAQQSKNSEHLAAAKAITARIGNDAQAQRNAPALLSLGVMYEGQGNADSAEAAYRQCLAIDPNQRIAQNNLAMLLTKAGKAPDEALKLAMQATRGEHPSLPSFLDTLA